jgi:hypothetical protein
VAASGAAEEKSRGQTDGATLTLPGLGGEVAMTVERIAPDGERFLPHCFRDGLYRVGDPQLGNRKHLAGNQIAITASEIVQYVRSGYSLRMRGEVSGRINLISPDQIIIRT